eukprot:TRINITY_DN1319_c0_g1_i1.p1 TRINITY_DN1319_c0_g1~~TRINITY_DN1319_c0_g1_i1.p1  ORF type:complete len:473 (-),score=167.85 TRINITY_DN1319_c0_g1_i1:203-1621(-)
MLKFCSIRLACRVFHLHAPNGLKRAGRLYSQRQVVVIMGPTGVGKSEVGIALAQQLGGEVVSADSAQIYRRLDVGTNKLDVADRGGVRHHLMDVVEPTDPLPFSAGRFVELAQAAVEEISARGKLPIVVGGTGFYIRWLVDGAGSAPVVDVQRVHQLVAEARQPGALDALLGRLATVDPEMAARLAPTDTYRLARSLAVHELTGHSYSSFRNGRAGGARSGLLAAGYDVRAVTLTLPSRTLLFRLLDMRCERLLMHAGMLDEVARLRHEGHLVRGSMAARCIGYSHALDFLDAGRLDVEALIDFVYRWQAACRKLAHSQYTWMRQQQPPSARLVRTDLDPGLADALQQPQPPLRRSQHRSSSSERDLLRLLANARPASPLPTSWLHGQAHQTFTATEHVAATIASMLQQPPPLADPEPTVAKHELAQLREYRPLLHWLSHADRCRAVLNPLRARGPQPTHATSGAAAGQLAA